MVRDGSDRRLRGAGVAPDIRARSPDVVNLARALAGGRLRAGRGPTSGSVGFGSFDPGSCAKWWLDRAIPRWTARDKLGTVAPMSDRGMPV